MVTSHFLTNFKFINKAIGVLYKIVGQSGNDSYKIISYILILILNYYPKDIVCLFQDNKNYLIILILLITYI